MERKKQLCNVGLLERTAKSSPIILTVLFLVLFIVLLFQQLNLASYRNEKNPIETVKVLNSPIYMLILAGTCGMSIPVSIDLVLDTTEKLINGDFKWLTLWIISVMLISLDFLQLIYQPSQIEKLSLYIYITHVKQVVINNFILFLVNMTVGSNVTVFEVSTVSITFTISTAFALLDWISNHDYLFVKITLRAVTVIFSILLWIKFFGGYRKNSNRSLSGIEQYCAFVYLSLFILTQTTSFIFDLIFGDSNVLDLNLTELILLHLSSFLVGLFMIFFHGRTIRDLVLITENALQTKRIFVRHVSHEIRTPLNTTLLGLKLLESELITEEKPIFSVNQNSDNEPLFIKEIVMDINASCAVAIDILNDLLMYEKLDEGILHLECSEQLLWPMVKDVVKLFKIQAKSLQVDLDWPDQCLDGVIVNVDRYKLSQVIRNLVSNALKFTPALGKVTISAVIIDANNGELDEKLEEIESNTRWWNIFSSKSDASQRKTNSKYLPFEQWAKKQWNKSKYISTSRQSFDLESGSNRPVSSPSQSQSVNDNFFTAISDGKNQNEEQINLSAPSNDTYNPDVSNHQLSYSSKSSWNKRIFPSARKVRILVTDTGSGISKADQKRLFNEIVQFRAEKLQKGQGSGLGLWISNSIVKLHEGSLGVMSPGEGLGSTFYIDLPLVKIESSQLRPASRHSPSLHPFIQTEETLIFGPTVPSVMKISPPQLGVNHDNGMAGTPSINRITTYLDMESAISSSFRYSKSSFEIDSNRSNFSYVDETPILNKSVSSIRGISPTSSQSIKHYKSPYQMSFFRDLSSTSTQLSPYLLPDQTAAINNPSNRSELNITQESEIEEEDEENQVSRLLQDSDGEMEFGVKKIDFDKIIEEEEEELLEASLGLNRILASSSEVDFDGGIFFEDNTLGSRSNSLSETGNKEDGTALSRMGSPNNQLLLDPLDVKNHHPNLPTNLSSISIQPLPSMKLTNAKTLPSFPLNALNRGGSGQKPSIPHRSSFPNVLPTVREKDINIRDTPVKGISEDETDRDYNYSASKDSAKKGGDSSSQETKSPFFDRKMLIVDDAALNRKLISRLLRDKIYHRDEAQNGLEACNMVRTSIRNNHLPRDYEINGRIETIADKTLYDLIVMDYYMPIMNGPEAAQEIRGLGYEGVIIGVTGNGDEQDISNFIKCGVDTVLMKPLDWDKFWTIVCDLFKKKKTESERLQAFQG